jgi:hypothetical protein
MRHIGRRYFLLLLILAASISSCTPSSAIDNATPAPGVPVSGEPAKSGTCANPLYPVIQGATWTYASTGSPAGPFLFIDTIAATHADGFTLASQFKDLTRTQEWACRSEGLLALQLGGGSTASISAQGLTAQFEASNATGISLPVDVQNTQQWAYDLNMKGTIAMPDNQASQADGNVSSTFQVLGTESISIPAGTFDTIKIQVDSEYTLNTSFQGFPMPLNFSSTAIMWYAPYVGWVKSIENSDFGGSLYSSTIELQSYSFP